MSGSYTGNYTNNGLLTVNYTGDNQIMLTSPSTWCGIGFNDSQSVDEYLWYNGAYGTFALGGGGSSVVNKEDAFVLFLVTFVTVIADLAIAVVVGVIVSALVFAWKHAIHISAKTHTDKDNWKVYELDGPLFFGSVSYFKEIFNPENDPTDVVIDFNESRIWDSSGIDALDTLADKYEAAGKKLHIRHISPECRTLLRKASRFVEINVNEDPRYYVASDELG